MGAGELVLENPVVCVLSFKTYNKHEVRPEQVLIYKRLTLFVRESECMVLIIQPLPFSSIRTSAGVSDARERTDLNSKSQTNLASVCRIWKRC
jgi:hypothetical protein